MALAETARLIASLELQDKFSGTAHKFEGTLSSMEAKTSTLSRIGSQVGAGLGAAAHNLALIGAAGAGLLAANITAGVRSLEKLESANAQTEAVLKSTQSVAGQTGESIRRLAEKYEGLNAIIDDKVIQSGENLLLTFVNVKEKAFEPALAAILDMNQALGGGEEGLQDTVIRVGKALNDPIRGITALRRVGVAFSDAQVKQIKQLVAQNDLFGAQQIILQELTTEFGGSFARAGDTAAGKFAKVRDAVDDAQQALATAFLPVLVKVADKLGTFLADPATVQRIQDFGGQLAGGLDKVLQVGGSLPWQEIGEAFKIVGTGSKALLDAFLGLPPWVQTAVLTGWGLNKLTGGALGDIAGTITKALVTGSFAGRGSTPLNPLFVQQVGGVGGGGIPPIAGFPAIGLGTIAVGLVALLGTGLLIAGAEGVFDTPAGRKASRDTLNALKENGFSKWGTVLPEGFQGINARLDALNKTTIANQREADLAREKSARGLLPFDTLPDVAREKGARGLLPFNTQDDVARERMARGLAAALSDTALAPLGSIEKDVAKLPSIEESQKAILAKLTDQKTSAADTLDRLRAVAVAAERTANKDWKPTINVKPNINVSLTSNVSVSVSNVVRAVNSYTAAIGSGPGGAVPNPY